MNRIILIVTLLFLPVVYSSNFECPPADAIKPCKCSADLYPVTVTCTKIDDQEIIKEIFAKKYDHTIGKLEIVNSTILYVPASIVDDQQLGIISISNSTISSIFDDAPKGNLNFEVDVFNTKIQRGVIWELFKNLEMWKIHFENVEIRRIGVDTYKYIHPNTRSIVLAYTGTTAIHKNAFSKLSDLMQLVIVYGSIKTIQRSMLPTEAHKLAVLDFTGNKIQSLPDDIFEGITTLRRVNFAKNQIKNFPAIIWENVWDHSLQDLDMNDNPLICDCSVRWFMHKRKYATLVGTCAEPSTIAGKTLRQLRDSDFTYCPLS